MASEDYGFIGAVADMDGHIAEIGRAGAVVVVICATGTGELYFDAAGREQFQRLFTEAERQAEAYAAQHPQEAS